MSKLDAKVFSSITPFAKQWILGDEAIYDFLYDYQDILSNDYGIVDLGSLNDWAIGSQGDNWYSQSLVNIVAKPAARDVKAGCYCSAYQIVARTAQDDPNPVDLSFSVAPTGNITVIDLAKVNYTSEQFQAAMQGIYVVFRLADNIGRVRLGGLNWEEGSEQGGFLVGNTQMQALGIKQGLCQLYSPNFGVYLSNFQWANFDNIPNNVVAKNNGNYTLYAKATDYATPADFKVSLANTYLYFEKN